MAQPFPPFKASSLHFLYLGTPLRFEEVLCNSEGRLERCYQSFCGTLPQKVFGLIFTAELQTLGDVLITSLEGP